MNSVRKLGFKLLLQTKSLSQKFYHPKKLSVLRTEIPYYSQWESKELVDKILSEEINAEDDPNWKNSGAKNKLDYRNWSWSACGMACFQMVLKTITGKKVPLIDLGRKSLKYDCYQLNKSAFEIGDYLNSLPGLFYRPFVDFIKAEYNLNSKIVSPMMINDIVRELENNNFVIVSVNSNIRDPKLSVLSSGHLVLMTGYDWNKKLLFLHNPSGLPKKSQEHARISFQDFERFFHNRGIVIKNHHNV